MTSRGVQGGIGRCDTYIPHPCITSHNIASLSQHAHDNKGAARRQRKLGHVDRLLGDCDILCLQETNLGKHDHAAVTVQFKNHAIFHNNLSLGKAGKMILVNAAVQQRYSIKPISLPEAQDGRVQVLRFTSKSHSLNASENSARKTLITAGRSAMHLVPPRFLGMVTRSDKMGPIGRQRSLIMET